MAGYMEVIVTWKRLVFVCALLVCLLVLTLHASGQNGPCLKQYQYCAICGDTFIPGSICTTEITFLAVCTVPSPACAPPPAPYEKCAGCASSAAGPGAAPGPGADAGAGAGAGAGPPPPVMTGKPVNVATGNAFIRQLDLRVPGLGGGLTQVRTWNSRWPYTQTASQVGMFGPNWRSTYEERVFLGSDNYMKYARSDGSFISFAYLGPVWVVAGGPTGNPNNNVVQVTNMSQGATNWTITFQNGEQRIFNATSGSLMSITDRNGNTTQLTYDSLNRLVTVTDPVSRTITYTYQSPTSYLVTGVSTSVGISLSYAYDTQNRLSQVTNPDLTTLNFAYNSQSLITSVTDMNGKVLESHTYDSESRGLTSTRALGVESITLTYPNP
jgi:YD repeat-containing protein